MTNESAVKMERSALSVLSVQSPSVNDLGRQSAIISVQFPVVTMRPLSNYLAPRPPERTGICSELKNVIIFL